jgi:hypothetical protein
VGAVCTIFGVFLCENPSRADALWLDPTAKRCNNLAVHWSWRGFAIVNVNPFVASDCSSARAATIPSNIIAENDSWIHRARHLADVFVIAAGSECHQQAISAIKRLAISGPFHAIRRNEGGGYLHPSRVSDESDFPSPIPIDVS